MAKVRRLSRTAGLLMVVTLFSAPIGVVQAALVWQIETVDSAGIVGWDTSLALDSNGHPHISYYDGSNSDLKYASFDGTSWQVETVDATGNVGWYTSLALDAVDQPHISYYDIGSQNLKYAVFDGTSWRIETVDSAGAVGWYTSLELDAAGHPHIGYHDQGSGDLKYAYHDGTAWQIETIDDEGDAGDSLSLALDSAGNPHIGYQEGDNNDLKYASFDGTSWTIETVNAAEDAGTYVSLALDAADQPHISYYDGSNGDLKYVTLIGDDWSTQSVNDGGVWRYISLALDATGLPHIGYQAVEDGDLKYASLDGTSWQIETVEAVGTIGMFVSLALDDADRPHISYFDDTNGHLKYAHAALNQPPTVGAGGPYSGEEGSPINLIGAVTDPESDELTTAWSYTIDTAGPGTTCTFGDASQVATTFTCTDDGTFTVTLEANDGLNPSISDSATVMLSNANPVITEITGSPTGSQVTITVAATDPGENDVLSYAFDCDNDTSYEVDAGTTPTTTCPLNAQQEGTFTFGVQVSDDDGGIATDTASATIATELCANKHTGVLRYASGCRDYETTVIIASDASVTLCVSTHNGLLRSPSNGVCAGHETTYVLPEDGPLNVCISNHTQTMRAIGNISQCTNHEFGRVIATTDVSVAPPRSR